MYGLTAITDALGRAETFGYASGHVTTATSAVSGRTLAFAWSTPSGATSAHVSTVTTSPVAAGSPSTALVWAYTYSGDQLTKVCTSGTCSTYAYSPVSQYPLVVQNAAPHSYWRLNESDGTTANSSALANENTDAGQYTDVTLGQAAALPGSTSTSASFNGTSSSLDLKAGLVNDANYQSVSMWFRTTTAAGVLFSYQTDAVTSPTTGNGYVPALYIGSDGRLWGQFWNGGIGNAGTNGAVTDGNWHHVVLAGGGNTQQLYLDGAPVGNPIAGQINLWDPSGSNHVYVGAGFLGGGWPDEPHNNGTAYATFFNGQISDVAFFDQYLSAATVGQLYGAGHANSSLLSTVTAPSGAVAAKVAYSTVTGAVSQVTDRNGGVWQVAAPTSSGSSQVYAASVLGAAPAGYWRLGETDGTLAVNQLKGAAGTYSAVTLGATSPFQDATAAAFDGSASYVAMPATAIPATPAESVGLWFNMAAGSTQGGVLYEYQAGTLGGSVNGWSPALYVGADGKLHGGFWSAAGNVASAASVNDGKWHYAVVAGSSTGQVLYLDGQQVGAIAKGAGMFGADHAYLGAGLTTGWPSPSTDPLSHFNGTISDFAYYPAQLSAAQVQIQYAALKSSAGLTPVETTVVTDPGGKTITDRYDLMNGGREISHTDALGNVTTTGYDTSGFVNTVEDPNGVVTITGHDVRGNLVSTTTCQNQAAGACATSYYTYYPDDTTASPSPDPRNDMLLTARDSRSSSNTDTGYETTFTYDAKGNQTSTTTPAVPGFSAGRTTTTAYTDGTSVAAADTGYAPAGLPATVTTPGNAVTVKKYYHNGDLAQTTDAAGLTTNYTYDNLGRVLASTAVSDSYPAGLTTIYTYDGLGRVLTQTDPAVTDRVTGTVHTARKTLTYNDDGAVLTQTLSDLTGGDAARVSSATYNANGQMATSTDAAGAVTGYGYDAYGRKTKQIDPDGTETDTVYDADGHELTTTLVGWTGDPAAPSAAKNLVTASHAYDPAGRLASVTDPMGWVTSYAYTDDGLTATITRADPLTGKSFVAEADTYDAAGNMLSKTLNNNTTKTTYAVDAANRVAAQTVDPAGVDRSTAYAYSADNAVLTTTDSDPSGTLRVTDATYDPMGRMTSQTVRGGDTTPTGRWKLDDGAGNTAADADGNQPGTAADVTWTAAHNGAAVFNGSDSAITTAGPVVDGTKSFTVSAWVYLTSTSDWAVAVSQAGGQQSAFALLYDPDLGKWGFTRWQSDTADPDNDYEASSNAAAATSTWTHLTGVFDAATGSMTLYVNGVAQTATAADPTPTKGTGPLVIGHGEYDGDATSFWTGDTSDVQTYGQALSASQVTNLYSGALPAATSMRQATAWTLDQRGLATRMTDPRGNVTDYAYDQRGQRVATTAPAVSVETGGGTATTTRPATETGYDTYGEAVEDQDAGGNRTTTAYDADGRVLSSSLPAYTAPGATTTVTPTTSHTYNGIGQVTRTTDALGHLTATVYDQLGRVARVTAPNGGVTRYTYDLAGDVLSTTDPTGAVGQATFDYLGRQLTSTQIIRQPAATAVNTAYAYASSGGWLSGVTSPGSVRSSFTYDNLGERITSTDGQSNTTKYAFDGLGRLATTTAPDGTYSTTSYNPAGGAVAVKDYDATGALLDTSGRTYDGDGDVATSTDPRGHTSRFTYDATGLLTAETQPVSASGSITTSFGYDVNGNRTRYTDGRGNPFITKYNVWGLPQTTVEPTTSAYPTAAARTTTDVYDANGRITQETLPGGVVTSYAYDAVGNLTGQAGTGAEATTAARTFGYDLDSRMTSASAPGGTDTFGYDDRGELLSTAGPSGTSSFTYTGDGNAATRADAAGTTSYTYDTDGRLATAVNNTAGVDVSVAYNSLSLPAKITYDGSDTRTLGYDTLHRLTSDTLKTSASAAVAAITYGYDADSNLTSKTTAGFSGASANTYAYDYANRLTSWNNGTTTTAYAYDAAGNRTQAGSRTLTYDARDRLTADGTSTYTYTARGTLASTTTSGTAVTTNSDAYGQVINQGTSTYAYDSLGRVVNSGFAYTGTSNTLAADGTATYARGPAGSLLAVNSTYAWTDQHSDVVGEFGAASGTLTGSATYNPFGAVTSSSGMVGNLGYQSGWTDLSSGRVNMGSRWYNPGTGQFDSHDSSANSPVPGSASANPFAYGDDNPMTGTDPDGHACVRTAPEDLEDISIGCAVRSLPRTQPSGPDGHNTGGNCLLREWGCPTKSATEPCPHTPGGQPNYLPNCSVVLGDGQGGVTVNNVHLTAAQLHGVDPMDFARHIDDLLNLVDPNADPEQATEYLVGAQLDAAVHHQQEVEAQQKAAECKASFWCRNAGVIGAVAGAIAGVGCGMLIGATGVGAVACGFAGGFIGSLTTGLLSGQSVSDPSLWMAATIGGVIGAIGGGVGGAIAKGVAGAVLGEAGEAAAEAGATLFQRVVAGAAGGAVSGGVVGAGAYAVTCQKDCSLAGFAEATVSAAVVGGVMGAAGGAYKGGRAPVGKTATPDTTEPMPPPESEPDDAPSSCIRHSFAPDTAVLMANGTTKAIAAVAIGDAVLAKDPNTGKTKSEQVTALHRNRDTDMTDVTVAKVSTSGTETSTTTLHTTWHHPLWDATTGKWADAESFPIGDKLETADGQLLIVIALHTYVAAHDMRDLTLADIHTYYVLAGNTPVLVHNSPLFGCSIGPADGPGDRLPAFAGKKTTGIFEGGTISKTLESGYDGPSVNLPRGTPGMDNVLKSHVEAHAAALMRQNGLTSGTLYINRIPCEGGCDTMLPRMLPESATLRVYGPGGYDETFTGLPD